jgi:hypothetical protein
MSTAWNSSRFGNAGTLYVFERLEQFLGVRA